MLRARLLGLKSLNFPNINENYGSGVRGGGLSLHGPLSRFLAYVLLAITESHQLSDIIAYILLARTESPAAKEPGKVRIF